MDNDLLIFLKGRRIAHIYFKNDGKKRYSNMIGQCPELSSFGGRHPGLLSLTSLKEEQSTVAYPAHSFVIVCSYTQPHVTCFWFCLPYPVYPILASNIFGVLLHFFKIFHHI